MNELRTLNGKFRTKLIISNKNCEGSFMFALHDQRDLGSEKDSVVFNCLKQPKVELRQPSTSLITQVANKLSYCENSIMVLDDTSNKDAGQDVFESPTTTTKEASLQTTPKKATFKKTPKTYNSLNNPRYTGTGKDYANWKFEKINEAIEVCGGDKPDVELFCDDDKSNSVFNSTSYSPSNDAFTQKWTGKYFYGNPDYNDDFIKKTLTKALWDFGLEPFTTRFMFVLPNWKTASWYPLLRHFDTKIVFPTKSDLFSAENIPKLNPANAEFTESNRTKVGPTTWEVLIVYKDCNTETKIDGAMKLHLMFGHKSNKYIKEAIKNDIQCLALIGNNLSQLDVPIFCSVCNAAKSRTVKALREYPLAERPMDSLHCDLKVYSLGSVDGFKYILGIIDSYSRFAWIYFLKKKSDAADKLKDFVDMVHTNPEFKICGNSLRGSRLIGDNAKEFTGKEFRQVALDAEMSFSTTAEYKHTDNAMIESFWRNEQVVRSMLLGAPHTDRRLWPYAWSLATRLHNYFPHKYHGQGTLATTDIMQQSPYETLTGEKPPLAGFRPFGLPVKVHIPQEKRNMSADPKLIARSFQGYFLCPDPKQPTKILVQQEETGNIISTGFYQAMYGTDTLSRIVSNVGMRNTLDLDTIQENMIGSQISQNEISQKKSVHARKILDVSVTEDKNGEIIGVLKLEVINSRNVITNDWITLPVFLTGAKTRIFAHKKMLDEFLHKHFQYRQNIYYPIFIQTEVKVKTNDKKNPIKLYPGIIIGTDANSNKGYFTALYETGEGQENVCDLHDCPATDIVQFEVAKILAPCFTLCDSTLNSFSDSITENVEDSETLHVLLRNKKPMSKRQKDFLNDPTLPQSYRHAQGMPDWDKWKQAFQDEIDGLYKVKKSFIPIKSQDLENYKDCKKILRSSVVCKRKLDQDGNVKRHKVRIVIGGNDQHAGDGTFDDTFAPTANLVTQRLCFALAVNLGLKPYQLDVEQAFLNADIDDKTILVKLPGGIEIEGCTHVKLLKAVYGLKQSPNLWYKLCYDMIIKCDSRLTRSKTDPCFFHYIGDDLKVLLTVTVDDIAIFTNKPEWVTKFKEKFNQSYAVTQEPDFTWFLGIKMEWNSEMTAVKLTQPNHLRSALIKYNMVDCKPQKTPMSPDFDSTALPEDTVSPDFPYSGLIGTLIWIARNTRPDILNAVTMLASHNKRFSERHIKEAKRVLAYLKGTENHGLMIRKAKKFDITQPMTLNMYSDSDWGRDKTSRRSVTGFVGFFQGSPIVTQACYQPTVATSSCEAEYMAAANALKEILYFVNVFREIELVKFQLPVPVYIDNTGAIDLISTQVSNKRTKHIDIRHHMIRDAYEDGTICPIHVPTDDNTADLFTKPLADVPFCKHRDAIVTSDAP
jgi:hypothetical protein